jgi:hypothetical protein
MHPFAASKFDLLSMVATPVEMSFQGKEIAHGTGFLWRHDDKVYLITNWHNVTGVHPFDGSHLNKGACVPDSITYHPAFRSFSSGSYVVHRETFTRSLYEHFHEPFWVQHTQFETMRTDIVALEVSSRPSLMVTLQDMGFENLFTHVGSEVFVVGYPFKDNQDPYLPLWKRGSIASEPLMPWDGKPIFMIDAASRPGMSGSPVFRRVFGPAPTLDNNSSIVIKNMAVMTTQFAGVYSGHLTKEDENLTIGIAWHGSLVSEILASPSPGTRG